MDSSIFQMLQFPMPSFPAFLICVLLFLMIVRNWKNSTVEDKLPPGPKRLPIIGNLHQLPRGLPHHSLTKLCKQHGPVVKLQLGQVVVVVVSSPDAAKEVLKTKEINFAQRPELYVAEIMSYDNSGIVFCEYNDYWRQMRRISVSEVLSVKRVMSFKSIREEEVWNLIESISSSEGRIINVSERIFSMSNDVISRAAFGKRCKDKHDFTSLNEQNLLIAGHFGIADFYPSLPFLRTLTGTKPALLKIQKKIDNILEDIINEHKMKRKTTIDANDDIVDTLLNYVEVDNDDFCLTTDQVKAVALDLFFAGTDTSATSMEWALAELIKNPTAMEKAQAEVRHACQGKSKIEEEDVQNLDYLKAVIKETFRLHPPGPIIPREARESCEISGYTIPAKAKLLINAYAIGRDPKLWKDPERFQPERFEGSSIDFRGMHFELLPFGAGRRICPGISFATATMTLALAQIIYHFDWKLPNGYKLEDLDMTENYGLTARKNENLHLIATTCIPFQK